MLVPSLSWQNIVFVLHDNRARKAKGVFRTAARSHLIPPVQYKSTVLSSVISL
jgi:hypothetical protein